MERGIYFDGWFRHNHCYHPGLPLRSMQMLEDLERYHATVLCWAGLGGGSISLPYLEHEAFGPVDPRMQMYGFMNDREFIAECTRRGIRLFGIVFEVQGWEFPAVFNESGQIIRLNQRAEGAGHAWYGLNEFGQDRYPHAFPKTLKDYYPEGIRDEEGNPVSNLRDLCCCRDRFGNPIHARWVEVKDHEADCYQMCRNNPVWRAYLKKIMEIQIDAGVCGIQLDECELPMTSISSGGCFCKSCMRQFTAFLKERKAAGKLGAQWNGVDLNDFDYGEYLKAHDCTFPEHAPFFREYWEFQVRQVRRHFGELADYAREYALKTYGRKLEISGNFYNMQTVYYPIEDKVDIVITEMDRTLLRQPSYYRYCAGFAPDKTVIIAENPYGGIIPGLLEMLERGRGYDLYRIFLLEASMYGCNMSVPYGGWMGNTIRNAFWAPGEVTAGVQDFLAGHEECFPKGRSKGAAVLYSYGSYAWRDSAKGSGANGMQEVCGSLLEAEAGSWLDPDGNPVPFWDVVRAMSARNAQYDVVMLPDGDLRRDDFSAEKLRGYPLVIVPDCDFLTERQGSILADYAQGGGGKVLVLGRLPEGMGLRARLQQSGNAVFVPVTGERETDQKCFMEAFETLYAPVSPLECREEKIGVQRYDREGNTWIHILNYRYDADADRVLPLDCLRLTVPDLGGRRPVLYTLPGEKAPECTVEGGEIILHHVGLYTVAALLE